MFSKSFPSPGYFPVDFGRRHWNETPSSWIIITISFISIHVGRNVILRAARRGQIIHRSIHLIYPLWEQKLSKKRGALICGPASSLGIHGIYCPPIRRAIISPDRLAAALLFCVSLFFLDCLVFRCLFLFPFLFSLLFSFFIFFPPSLPSPRWYENLKKKGVSLAGTTSTVSVEPKRRRRWRRRRVRLRVLLPTNRWLEGDEDGDRCPRRRAPVIESRGNGRWPAALPVQ